MKPISLKKSNLWLTGTGHDLNGNKVIRLSFPNSRGFSLQTGGGSLSKTDSLLKWKKNKDLKDLTQTDLKVISKEVCNYIKKFGTDLQKKKLRTY